MIDRAKSFPPSSVTRTLPMFWRISAIGSSTPIIPVLATSTSSSSTPTCRAASAAMSCASSRPCSPTQQFAHPLFATTACADPVGDPLPAQRHRGRLDLVRGEGARHRGGAIGHDDAQVEVPLARRLQSGERPAGPVSARRRNAAASQYLHHPSTCQIPEIHAGRRNPSHHPAASPTNRKYTIRALPPLHQEKGQDESVPTPQLTEPRPRRPPVRHPRRALPESRASTTDPRLYL